MLSLLTDLQFPGSQWLLTESGQQGRIEYSSRELGHLQLGRWGVELASGYASCVSKHHSNPAERYAPRVGEFSGMPEQCLTLLWWLNFIGRPDSSLLSMRRHVLWCHMLGWFMWSEMCWPSLYVMRKYSVFISDYRKLYEFIVSLHIAFQRTVTV